MLLDIDNKLSSAVILEFWGAGSVGVGGTAASRVAFQFPPRLVSDGKEASWVEGEQRGSEPIAYYKTSGARKLRLEWTYIVGETGGADGSGNPVFWDVERVRAQVAGLRWYYHNLAGNMSGDSGGTSLNSSEMVAKIKLWNHGDPDQAFTARLLGVDIKHGKTLFVPHTNNGYRFAFPLRTDIGLDLRLWTNAGTSEGVEDDKSALQLSKFEPDLLKWR